jgi:N-acyl-D-aspartate/D-glutamate deacylase
MSAALVAWRPLARAVLAHPQCLIETDTFVTRDGHQNPASYGTFPRALSTYVRAGLFSLEEALVRATDKTKFINPFGEEEAKKK